MLTRCALLPKLEDRQLPSLNLWQCAREVKNAVLFHSGQANGEHLNPEK
jgi:hypothetical protein